MKRQIKKTILVTVILAILVISQTVFAAPLQPAAASGPVSQFVYDNFDDNVTDSALWSVGQQGGPVASEMNQRLEITLPANSSGEKFDAAYYSTCQLRGDFDIQVDYELLAWPPTNGVRISLNTSLANMERVSFGASGDLAEGLEVYLTDYAGLVKGITSTSDVSGKLRLERIGNTITGYYFYNGGWVVAASNSDSGYSQDTGFALSSWSHDPIFADQEVKIAFDNLVINTGELICPSNNVATGQIMPISGTCAQFAAGTAANLDEATYKVYTTFNNKKRVDSISPMEFYYYSKVIAPAASFQIKVSQFNTGGWPNLFNSLFDTRVYDANCASVGSRRPGPGSSAAASIPVTVVGATPGAVYYIGMRFQANNLVSRLVTSPYPTVRYTFTTAVNDTLIDTGTDSILIRYQP